MSAVVIAGDTSGSVTLQAPAVAGTTTLTLPNSSGTLMATGGALGTPTSGDLTNCTFPTLNQNTTGNAATATLATSATTATNLAGGGAGTVPYQTGSGATAMLAAGSSGQLLKSNGAAAPSWVTVSSGPSTTYGDVGTYVIAYVPLPSQFVSYGPGTTHSGSSLLFYNDAGSSMALNAYNSYPTSSQIYPSVIGNNTYMTSLGLSGTWRTMTYAASNWGSFYNVSLTLLVRIS